jgi:lipoprotein-anchoring transpeptidase ErfK/SrfK
VSAILLAAALAGCSGSGHATVKAAQRKPEPPPVLTVTPANGTAHVAPDSHVQVSVTGGTLTQVAVTAGGDTASGQYGTGNTTWSSQAALKPSTTYTVTATARTKKGTSATSTTSFTTLTPARTLKIDSITPDSGETVGIGMPLIVDFNHDVADSHKAAVEKALQVESDTPVTGAWLWTSDSEAVFRTQQYWPANEHVKLVADLTGIHAGAGLWGASTTSRAFTIGDSHIVKVNLGSDEAHFYINGKLTRTIPVSGGMGGSDSHGNDFYTTGGIHLTMGSYDSVWMTSPNIQPGQPGYYHEIVYHDVQISDSGEYMHQTPGDEECLGNENCSHGCVRMTASGAAWWQKTAYRGDPVTITGTPRSLAWDNGWGYWQKSWSSWLKGSSAGAVTTTALPGGNSGGSAPTPSPSVTPTPTAIPTTAG